MKQQQQQKKKKKRKKKREENIIAKSKVITRQCSLAAVDFFLGKLDIETVLHTHKYVI